MPRDSQKSKVYKAERLAFATGKYSSYPVDFPTDREMQAFVNQVTRSKFWKSAGGTVSVIVKPVPNNRYARGWDRIIEIPDWGRTKSVVLHELSHALVGRELMDYTHGQEFVLVYRRLIEEHMGTGWRQMFDREAEALKVKWGIGAMSSGKIAAGIGEAT